MLRDPADHSRKPNRLASQKSPYLLQHATNPVDWRPWGEEAFRAARDDDKPVFLSIGYSTCHWCHVMERESFEDDTIAALLNRWFVPVKVDREERPDVDRVYMTAMQTMGAGGGWPLNVFLTPDLKPFFGGTYFPPRSAYGRPGLAEVLSRVHEVWTTQRADLERTGDQVLAALASLNRADREAPPIEALIDRAFRELSASYDARHGGFGTQPKFPSTVNLDFLLRVAMRDPARREAALSMVLHQLDAMRAGGIHDHVGGGFHRYSTDAQWLVPHFEKMLYDQALIATAFLDAFQVARRPVDAAAAHGIFEYVARDLTARGGAFDSAEDADSEGEEGKFYVWTPAELTEVLGADDAHLVALRFGVTPAGNFEGGASILHESQDPEDVARKLGTKPDEVERRWQAARSRLLAARSRRPRPHRDDKVITAWNGLMITAFARGARVLEQPEYASRASRAADFLWSHLRDEETGVLRRRWREGEAAEAGQLDDYAYFAQGLLELYAATFDPLWLERAVEITARQIELFWDEEQGGFFESPADPSIHVRLKDGHDGAEVAGNSVAAWNLQRLAEVLDRDDWRRLMARTLEYYARRLEPFASAMPRMLMAMDLAAVKPRHVVVAGDPAAADTRAMIRVFDRRYLPDDMLMVVDSGERRKRLARLAPFVATLAPQGAATAYVCVDRACRLPTDDLETFAAELEGAPAAVTGKETSR